MRRKGSRRASIPLNYQACHALRAYLKIRPTVAHSARGGTQFKPPMHNRALPQAVAPSRTEVPTLRHTLATHRARGTARKTVQETLARFLKTQENLHALRR